MLFDENAVGKYLCQLSRLIMAVLHREIKAIFYRILGFDKTKPDARTISLYVNATLILLCLAVTCKIFSPP